MIESLQNKAVKQIKGWKNKKEREKSGVFLAEGIRFLEEIPSDWKIEKIVVSEEFSRQNDWSRYQNRAEVLFVSDTVFESMSDTENPQGILAVCRQKKNTIEEVLQRGKELGFYLIAEELNDPGNLGTIVRTADACGVQGVFLSQGSVDFYNSKVLRATMGSVFHVPVVQNCILSDLINKMKQKGIAIYAAHLKGAITPYELDCQKPCAFLIGNEARGLKKETAELADQCVKIPMPGQAESLNASIAAGVLMYEAVRQRIEK